MLEHILAEIAAARVVSRCVRLGSAHSLWVGTLLVCQPSAPYECDGRGLRPRVRRASEWCKKDAQRRMAIVAFDVFISGRQRVYPSMGHPYLFDIPSHVLSLVVRLPTREGGAAIRTMWAWIAASCKLEF